MAGGMLSSAQGEREQVPLNLARLTPRGVTILRQQNMILKTEFLTREQFLLSIEIIISSFLAWTLVPPRDSNIPAVFGRKAEVGADMYVEEANMWCGGMSATQTGDRAWSTAAGCME